MKKFLPRSASNPQGFTLIELMVAMAILAILAVAGLVLFTGAQKNARDARRRQDIDAITTALETNKVQGASTNTYSALASNQFAAGTVPSDNVSSKYCVDTETTAGNPIAAPTSWPTDPCPTGFATVSTTTSAGPPATDNGGGSVRWTVCALLENGTDRVAVTPTFNIFCKSSSQ